MEKDIKQICSDIADFFRKCHGVVFEASGVSDLVSFRNEKMETVSEVYESVKSAFDPELRASIDSAFAGMHAMGNEMSEIPDTLPAVLREAVEILSDPDALICSDEAGNAGQSPENMDESASSKVQPKKVLSSFIIAGIVIVVTLVLGFILVKNLFGISSQEIAPADKVPQADVVAVAKAGVVDVDDPLVNEQENIAGGSDTASAVPAETVVEEEHVYIIIQPDLEAKLGTYGGSFFKGISKVVSENYTNLSSAGVLPAPQVQEFYDAAQAGTLGQPETPESKPKTYSQCLLDINQNFSQLAADDQSKIKTVSYFRIPADEERLEKFKNECLVACKSQGILVDIEQKRNIFFIGFKDYFATFTTIQFDPERRPGKAVYFTPAGTDKKIDVFKNPILSLSGHFETQSTKELIFYVMDVPLRCTYLEWLTLKEKKKSVSVELQHKVLENAGKDMIEGEERKLLMEFRIKGPIRLDFDFLKGRALKIDVEKGKFFVSCEAFGEWIRGVKIKLSNFCSMRLYENSQLIMQAESDYAFESGKKYLWGITAVDQYGGSVPSMGKRSFLFDDKAALPAAFGLFAPVKGRIMRESNKNIPLQWTKSIVPGKYEPITYHVWLSSSPDFNKYQDLPVIDINGYTIRDSLSDGTYYWRVFAENPSKIRRWASQKDFFFVVKDSFEEPKTPVPLNPFIDEIVSTISPKLVAAVPEGNTDTINPVSYLFEIDTSEKFDSQNYHASANVHPQKKGEVAWIPNKPLKENVRWYWRCRATNGILQSPFSSVSWFTPRRYGQGVEKINLAAPDADAYIGEESSLSWEPVQAPYDVRYTLIIDSQKNFFEPEFKMEDIDLDEIPFKQIKDKLKDNLRYYWMVKVFDPDTQELSFSSDIRSFYINFQNDEPTDFSLVAPADGETLCFGNPVFFWTKSTDSDIKDSVSYELSLYEEGKNLPVFTKQGITSTFYEMKYYKLIELKAGKADLLSKGFMKGKKILGVGDSYKIEFDKIKKLG